MLLLGTMSGSIAMLLERRVWMPVAHITTRDHGASEQPPEISVKQYLRSLRFVYGLCRSGLLLTGCSSLESRPCTAFDQYSRDDPSGRGADEPFPMAWTQKM